MLQNLTWEAPTGESQHPVHFSTVPARPEADLWNDGITWPEDISVTNVVIPGILCLCSKTFEKCPPFGGAPTGR